MPHLVLQVRLGICASDRQLIKAFLACAHNAAGTRSVKSRWAAPGGGCPGRHAAHKPRGGCQAHVSAWKPHLPMPALRLVASNGYDWEVAVRALTLQGAQDIQTAQRMRRRPQRLRLGCSSTCATAGKAVQRATTAGRPQRPDICMVCATHDRYSNPPCRRAGVHRLRWAARLVS